VRPARPDGLRRTLALLVARPFFALAVVLGRVLPARWLLRLATHASRATYALFPGVRRNVLENARHVLGADSSHSDRARLARAMLASFARFIVEWVAPRCAVGAETIFERFDGREYFDAATAGGRGVVAVTLHMGNYEIPGRELAALGRDVAVVFNRERVSFLERLRSRTRREKRLDEIVIEESRFFGIDVMARLRRGGIVLIAGDQVGAPEAARFAFLDGAAAFSLWPARLARAAGAALLPSFCWRDANGALRLTIEPPIEAADRDVREVTAELVAVLASWLRRYPEQWLMVHDFWDTPGARSAA